jgi:GNAT superfamily N-acetyltransferase
LRVSSNVIGAAHPSRHHASGPAPARRRKPTQPGHRSVAAAKHRRITLEREPLEVVTVSQAKIPAQAGRTHVALVGGRVAVVRAAEPSDADRVRTLHQACEPHTLRDRYLGSPPRLTDSALATLLAPPGGCSLLACGGRADGELLGMVQVAGSVPVAEIAVLVRDDHQCRGLGTILAQRAMAAALSLGYREMVVFGAAGNAGLMRLLSRLGLREFVRYDGSVLTLRAPLGVDLLGGAPTRAGFLALR